MLSESDQPARAGGDPMRLTALPEAICAATFSRDAADWERLEAEHRTGKARRRYLHVHGALRLVLAQWLERSPAAVRLGRHADGRLTVSAGVGVSISYCGPEAYCSLDRNPIGLDVVDVLSDGPRLDPAMVRADELETVGDLRIGRADLAVWAAKEAAAKLTGDVRAEPERWRLVADSRGHVILSGHPEIRVEFVRLDHGHLAAVTRWCGSRGAAKVA